MCKKTQKKNFISYTGTSKNLGVWASYTHQVLIASELIVNESKKDADLLVEHLLLILEKPLRPQTSEPKPRGQSCKRPYPEDIVREENTSRDKSAQAIVQTK